MDRFRPGARSRGAFGTASKRGHNDAHTRNPLEVPNIVRRHRVIEVQRRCPNQQVRQIDRIPNRCLLAVNPACKLRNRQRQRSNVNLS